MSLTPSLSCSKTSSEKCYKIPQHNPHNRQCHRQTRVRSASEPANDHMQALRAADPLALPTSSALGSPSLNAAAASKSMAAGSVDPILEIASDAWGTR